MVAGLETHVELSTKTKIFCGCTTKFGGEPNTNCCPVCIGLPGTLPKLNHEVVRYAIKAGLVTNCTINPIAKMDRKNYVYPDLPKAYQISQYDKPLCEHGYIDLSNGRRIRITRIHIEEDAGKLVHSRGDTFVDYNRGGVPLIEIVTEPDIRSVEEIREYLEKLQLLMRTIGVSDCRMQEGSLRCDVNLSVRRKGEQGFGVRTEMKNLNSFKAIRRAIEGETERQMDLLDAGEKVVQETRRWDDNAGESYAMRSKEDAQDYRYFPDPDLVPIVLSDEFLEEIRSRQPEFRNEKRIRYREEFGIPDYDIEIITGSKKMADLFEQTVALGTQPKKVSNWLMGETLRILKEKELDPEDIRFSPEHLSALIALQDSRAINGAVAKEVFEVMFEEDMDPVSYVEEKGLKTVNDEGALRKTVEEVIANNPQSVEDYHNGKEKAIGFLVGQTMKAMKGKCDPGMVNQLLKELL